MEESFGAQYALQIALQTLRERCHQFQQRVATLEEENLNLRTKCDENKDGKDSSIVEMDFLKREIVKLTEQKTQLINNIQMISSENKCLWARLSKLTQANENLGSKLNKINDTLTQHNANILQHSHATLIRSKTFTQEEPRIKFLQKNVSDESDKISLELEDISLKLISSIAKEKSELEMQCSQMTEIQNGDIGFINSYAFTYPINEINDTVPDEIDEQLTNLKNIKTALLQEKDVLQKNVNYLKTIKNENNHSIKTGNITVSVSVQTNEKIVEEKLEELESSTNWETTDDTNVFGGKTSSNPKALLSNDIDKICPMCSKLFPSSCKFTDFQLHVENHFISESDVVSNFDVVP